MTLDRQSKLLNRMRQAKRGNTSGKSKYCKCCCVGSVQDEQREIKRARRRAGKLFVEEGLEDFQLSLYQYEEEYKEDLREHLESQLMDDFLDDYYS